jgi:hypothetical protein
MKHQLSFATVNIMSDDVAEVVVNEGIDISLEMSEEYDEFLSNHFSQNFGLLVNKINSYDFSFEAKLNVASHENLTAIAVVIYNENDRLAVEKVATMRQRDGWNLRIFDGLNMGWQEATGWLQSELKAINAEHS